MLCLWLGGCLALSPSWAFGACPGARLLEGWFRAREAGERDILLNADAKRWEESGKLFQLSSGEAAELLLYASPAKGGSLIDHSIQFWDGNATGQGWSLSFRARDARVMLGNLVQGGRVQRATFVAAGYRPLAWNRLRFEVCHDGRVRMAMNGIEVAQGIDVGTKPFALLVRALGMKVTLAPVPRAKVAP